MKTTIRKILIVVLIGASLASAFGTYQQLPLPAKQTFGFHSETTTMILSNSPGNLRLVVIPGHNKTIVYALLPGSEENDLYAITVKGGWYWMAEYHFGVGIDPAGFVYRMTQRRSSCFSYQYCLFFGIPPSGEAVWVFVYPVDDPRNRIETMGG